jgi:membrane-bound lytic murein transglycosylase B
VLVASALCLLIGNASAHTLAPEMEQYIAEVASTHGFKADELRTLLGGAQKKQSILDAISRPAERVVPWHEYRSRFLTSQRIAQGTQFSREQRTALAAAEARGVSASVILGILGVETSYGRNTGKFRVVDALSTLAFHYPPRAPFFRKELTEFLLLSRDERVDPASALGSYAGAMGAPQFIASSYRNYAVDGDGDGQRDLWRSWDDVIASVANYLAVHGWKAGEPVFVAAEADPTQLSSIDNTLALNETVGSLKAKGVRFETTLPDSAPAMFIVAQGVDGPQYRVGFTNFYAITRYNRSAMYAMAVHELGTAVAATMPHEKSP